MPTPTRRTYIESDITGNAIALQAWHVAREHAHQAFELATSAQHPVLCALAIAYCAPLCADDDPEQSALLFGYASERLRELQFDGDHAEKVALVNARTRIQETLAGKDADVLFERGAALTQQEAATIFESTSYGVHGATLGARDGVAALLR